MSSETIPALSDELAALFELGKQISDTEPFPDSVLIVHGASTYLFKDWGYRGWRSGAESVFPAKEGVSFELLAATRGHHAAQQETPFNPATEATDYSTVPELYVLNSTLSPSELFMVAKKDHFLGVCLAATTGSSHPEVSSVEYSPAWWQNPSKDFFRQRGLTAGSYGCNSLVQVVLDLVARPQDYENYDFSALDTYSENSLNYETQLGGFVMNMKLKQKLGESTSELVTVLERIQHFVFEGLGGFLEAKGSSSFAEYFSNFLGLDRFPPLKGWLEEETVDPFVDYDDRFASESKWWFTPSALRIQVEKLEIDPSFGTVSPESSKKFDILELRENWLKTDFASVNENAYLRRLVDQAQRYPAE
jgi:hypothetical protein